MEERKGFGTNFGFLMASVGSAVGLGAHLIGEAPDVAQADCRTDRRHQESKIGSKAFSFFHCFLSLLNTFP